MNNQCTCLSISRDPLCVFHGDINKVLGATITIDKLIWRSHLARCLIVGCFYGTATADACVYCGRRRPDQSLIGVSPIKTLTDRTT